MTNVLKDDKDNNFKLFTIKNNVQKIKFQL